MNSVMDDSRLLTLPSNERIPLKLHMKMIFEARLAIASLCFTIQHSNHELPVCEELKLDRQAVTVAVGGFTVAGCLVGNLQLRKSET